MTSGLDTGLLLDSFSEDCFEVTREAMLHLGIDTPTQNNIFKVRRKAMALIFGSPFTGSFSELVSFPEDLRLWAPLCSLQGVHNPCA